MQYVIISFLAGILTVFSPCVLPVLPVVLGGGVSDVKNKRRPFIITVSLIVSVILFTLLLKVFSIFINVPPIFWQLLSGVILVGFGLTLLFPKYWDLLQQKLNLDNSSSNLLQKADQKKGIFGEILVGVALGPVFASCSPTYALLLAVVFPGSFLSGLLNLIVYSLGMLVILLPVAIAGRNFIARFKWAVNPQGWFKKLLGIIFIVFGVLIATGMERDLELSLLNNGFINATNLENSFFTNSNAATGSQSIFNVTTPYPAPEFSGIENWINSQPLTLAGLKGKVVLVDFWTYSCINCLRTLPFLEQWNTKYKDAGLVIIGMHAPEFQFEKVLDNVQMAVSKYQITYPVAQDNNYANWTAFNNNSWPAEYFIDKNGNIRHIHLGEGSYSESETVIQKLLNENSSSPVTGNISDTGDVPPISPLQTPETYLGYERGANFANAKEFSPDKQINYSGAASLQTDQWALSGDWTIMADGIVSNSDSSILSLEFAAGDVYLVVDPDGAGGSIEVKLDQKLLGSPDNKGTDVADNAQLKAGGADLYHLVHSTSFRNGSRLDLKVTKGLKLHAFTFGA
jgi:cytochrome c biogenesis protein CcdA/thiol-disulfide isomerase/thioredoxin